MFCPSLLLYWVYSQRHCTRRHTMKQLTRKEFGHQTAHTVFGQYALLASEIILLLMLTFFLLIKQYEGTPLLGCILVLLLAAWIFHFVSIIKYTSHSRVTARIARLAGIDSITVVTSAEIRKRCLYWQSIWDEVAEQFVLQAPLCWRDHRHGWLIMGQAVYTRVQNKPDGIRIADYAVRDDLIELDGMLCTVPSFTDFLVLMFSRTGLQPPVSYKKGPAEKGFL